MRKLIALANWLNNHWLGDLIGVACLFGITYIGLVAAHIFGG